MRWRVAEEAKRGRFDCTMPGIGGETPRPQRQGRSCFFTGTVVGTLHIRSFEVFPSMFAALRAHFP